MNLIDKVLYDRGLENIPPAPWAWLFGVYRGAPGTLAFVAVCQAPNVEGFHVSLLLPVKGHSSSVFSTTCW